MITQQDVTDFLYNVLEQALEGSATLAQHSGEVFIETDEWVIKITCQLTNKGVN